MRRCRHSWAEIRRAYTPPVRAGFTVEWADPALFERALHGFTTVELRCEDCGDVKGVALLGDVKA